MRNVPQDPPDEVPGQGGVKRTPRRSGVQTRAGASAVKVGATALDELGASAAGSRGLSLRPGDAEAGNEPVGALGRRPERLPDQHVRVAPARRGKAGAAILLSALGGSLAVQMKMLVPQRKQDGRQFRLARGMQYAAPAPVVLSLLVRSGDEISGDSGYRSPRESARRSFLPSARRREVAGAITMSARSGVRICSGPVLSAVRADRAPAQHPRGRPR
jgi:hypothetical protein